MAVEGCGGDGGEPRSTTGGSSSTEEGGVVASFDPRITTVLTPEPLEAACTAALAHPGHATPAMAITAPSNSALPGILVHLISASQIPACISCQRTVKPACLDPPLLALTRERRYIARLIREAHRPWEALTRRA